MQTDVARRGSDLVGGSERRIEMKTHERNGYALITGASSGIGAVYADRLARRGYDLILVARDRQRLETLAARVRRDTGADVDVLPADLTSRADLARVEQRLREDDRITLLVNNAGAGATAPLVDSDPSAMSRLIALNVEALTQLTYAAVPAFVARGSGTIVNVGSVVAIAPERLNGVYGGSKAFVLAFSQSLRYELADTGVRIQVVMPGATATNFWSVAGRPVEDLPKEIVMSVDDMVDAALAGLDLGEFATIPALPDVDLWNTYEGARQALGPYLSLARPADRYGLGG
jgi:short-subunit dehydrogenase